VVISSKPDPLEKQLVQPSAAPITAPITAPINVTHAGSGQCQRHTANVMRLQRVADTLAA
jgi:hypothetical protein